MEQTDFEWDPAKALANLKKHEISFADAVTLFDDARALTRRDPDSAGEERFISVGKDTFGRVLVLVFTLRADLVRAISARRASRSEQRRYAEKR